jgi:protein-S-isoprenylcysteine O-methyltransferase Ste14
MGDAVEARVAAAVEAGLGGRTAAPADSGRPWITRPGLANAASNVCLALLFGAALLPGVHRYANSVADAIWATGAALMCLLSLVRVPPRTVAVNIRAISATAGMMIVPTLIGPSVPAVGILYKAGVAVEMIGLLLTQVARVYLGRRFGLLPANRGVVSSGPFAMVRHPIYSGWLLLTIGYTMIYPSLHNALVIIGTLPFMVWRIAQEEALLSEDPGYRSYLERVRYRLLPFIL